MTLIDGLIVSSDKIVIEIHIQIIHVLHAGHRVEDINIIHIEAVFGQTQAALPQKLCPVNHRMHKDILALLEMPRLIPGKHSVHGESASVLHHFLVSLSLLVIDKIADEQINLLLSVFIFFLLTYPK